MTGRLARQIPGYGGVFIDKQGVLNVYVADLPASSSARAVVQSELMKVGKPNRPIRFVKAQYSYEYLASLKKVLFPYWGYGVSMWSIDDRRNRFLIRVVSEEARVRIEKVIATLKLPRGAFIIEHGRYATPFTNQSLSGQVRPLVAGLQILTPAWEGSLGGIVKYNGLTYLLISSHVVNPQGTGGIGTPISQGAGQVGSVSHNPSFFTTPNCPGGQPCRPTDAALVLVSGGVSASLGSVAAPSNGPVTGGGSSFLTFDDAYTSQLSDEGRNCNIQGCAPDDAPGATASKVGFVTGWTGGTVLLSGADLQGSDGLIRRGSIVVEGRGRPGDSGGAVLSEDRSRLVGILWGGDTLNNTFNYSSIFDISQELTGNNYSLHPSPPEILGYEQRWRNDLGCMSSPDAFDMYVVSGWSDGLGNYETTQLSYAGYTTYWCGSTYMQGTFANAPIWQSCTDHFYPSGYGCPCARDMVGGGTCPTLEHLE